MGAKGANPRLLLNVRATTVADNDLPTFRLGDPAHRSFHVVGLSAAREN